MLVLLMMAVAAYSTLPPIPHSGRVMATGTSPINKGVDGLRLATTRETHSIRGQVADSVKPWMLTTMKPLQMALKRIGLRNRDGSETTRHDRALVLSRLARELQEMGFKQLKAHQISERHVLRLVAKWKAEGKSNGAMKNDLAHLRWWASKVGRGHTIAPKNEHYGIGKRSTVAQESKAMTLPSEQLVRVTCAYVRLSLELQRRFGLRREESIKFRVSYAWREHDPEHIYLKGSWTKGGRPRAIPVRTPIQRGLLRRVADLCGNGSLIPDGKTYRDQLGRYKSECVRAGIQGAHGLRHLYAQERYEELSGLPAPVNASNTPPITLAQREKHDEARQVVSEELGHGRLQIVESYIGSRQRRQKED